MLKLVPPPPPPVRMSVLKMTFKSGGYIDIATEDNCVVISMLTDLPSHTSPVPPEQRLVTAHLGCSDAVTIVTAIAAALKWVK